MAGLPKIDRPTHDVILPSSGKIIKIRPFTVKEEKIILISLASEDSKEMENATKQVINNCIVFPEININELTLYDLEYLFLQLRARSVGETLTLDFLPIADSECPKCKKNRQVEVDLLSIEVKKPEGHVAKIRLNDKLGVVLREPSFELYKEVLKAKKSQDFDDILIVIAKCVDEIFTDTQSFKRKDYKTEDFLGFLEGLTKKEFLLVDEFFNTLPRLRHTVHIDCPDCGSHQEYHMEGLNDFLV